MDNDGWQLRTGAESPGRPPKFLERVAPGAFAHTLARDRSRIRVLFQHGRDPTVGSKVLGIPTTLREDEQGGYYEVPLLDTGYNAELLPGLRAGAYGASFRFNVTREHVVQSPEASAYNPAALPERTIQEARVMEFGPVTFPAYQGASAGVRSLTQIGTCRHATSPHDGQELRRSAQSRRRRL